MNLILDPNVGYVLLVGGVTLSLLALFVPGSGLLETGAFLALLTAGYIIVNLPVNVWAIALLAVSTIPLTLSVRWRKGGWILLVTSLVMAFVGSIFAFRNSDGGPAVNPFVAIVVSGGTIGLIWFIARKSVDASALRPSHDQDKVVGMIGTVQSDLRPKGSVYVGGENWSARSREYIPVGTAVRVLRRTGLILDVEKVQTEE